MDKPYAITLDPGSSLANHTGSWRTERPVYVDRLPPCNNQCPAGEDIQGWLFHAESGNYEKAWRAPDQGQPLPGDHGPRLLPQLRKRLQPRSKSTPRSASIQSSVSSATKPSSGLEAGRRPLARNRQARAGRRRRPLGYVGRLSPARAWSSRRRSMKPARSRAA